MTDEQFKQLMDKLEELKRGQVQPFIPTFPQPLTQPGQYWDHYPSHWHTQTRD